MTQAEWLECSDPQPMLEYLRDKVSERKLRLFACACVRRVWAALPPGSTREVIRLSEDYADGKATSRDLARIRKPARNPVLHPSTFVALSLARLAGADFSARAASEVADAVTQFVGWECRGGRPVAYLIHPERVRAQHEAQAALLREVFGNPFRPAAVEAGWLTPKVRALAQSSYDGRAFDRLPLLAGALEEAGCADGEILGHLRVPGAHVLGCWALNLLLGKS
jgi:hypothetical protein